VTRIVLTTRGGASDGNEFYRGVPPPLELDVLRGEEVVLELLLALGALLDDLLPLEVLGLVALDVDCLEELLGLEPAFACRIERELELAALGLELLLELLADEELLDAP
jgi:hypothetical protein